LYALELEHAGHWSAGWQAPARASVWRVRLRWYERMMAIGFGAADPGT
jgi:hypothetical protein